MVSGSRIDEAIARAWLGEEVLRAGGVALELAPQLGDIDVEVVRLGLVRGSPDLTEDRLVREQLADVLCEKLDEPELVWSQPDELVAAVERSLVEIDSQLADLDHGRSRRRGATKRRTQPREELVDPEWLRHVVVGTRVERSYLLALLSEGREHEHGHLGPAA